MTVSVVAYGLGNVGSVLNMFKRVGVEATFVHSADEIAESERLLLPGVGAYDAGMSALEERELSTAITTFAASGRPLLGICLGMQLLFASSEEGQMAGLGLIEGRVERFAPLPGMRVPHMGWNHVEPTRADPLVEDLPADNRFYFVHSYRVVPRNVGDVLATTEYGESFASMVRSGNVMGAQFHPEKSHDFGKHILRNFARL